MKETVQNPVPKFSCLLSFFKKYYPKQEEDRQSDDVERDRTQHPEHLIVRVHVSKVRIQCEEQHGNCPQQKHS
jgi:hypothetical protein